MQPVQCWEKVWSTPEGVTGGSSVKVWKWVKTDKAQVRGAYFFFGDLRL
jgi:hypothetical protein